jgi:hypothetical protein
MSPLTLKYSGISGYIIFWLLFAVALGLFIQRFISCPVFYNCGSPEKGPDRLAYPYQKNAAVAFTHQAT